MNFEDKNAVEKLIASCIKGDSRSQQVLYKTFYSKMLAVCCRYSSNSDEAKDLLHDSFIKVFEKLKGFENKGSLEGWIRRIVVNNAIDFVRAKKEFVLSFDDDSQFENISDESDYNFEFEELKKIKAETIMTFVQKLSPAYRTVFNLFVVEDYSHKEIAEELNITIGSSKSNLAKAKMKLREMFDLHTNGTE